jgi:hypothetical protein
MSKIGSHYSFKYLRHKLWLKKRLGVKVSIWLPTIKSWKSPWIICMQEVCHISLESFWWGLQLCFKPHINWRSPQEVMGVQNGESPNFENCGTPNLAVPRKTPFGCSPCGKSHKRWWFPQIWAMVSLVSPCMYVVHSCTKNVPIMH